MTFYRTRIIKGRQYLYKEERYRQGGKVKSKSTFIGAVTGFLAANLSCEGRGVEKAMEQAEKEKAALIAASQAAITPSVSGTPQPSDLSLEGETSPASLR